MSIKDSSQSPRLGIREKSRNRVTTNLADAVMVQAIPKDKTCENNGVGPARAGSAAVRKLARSHNWDKAHDCN